MARRTFVRNAPSPPGMVKCDDCWHNPAPKGQIGTRAHYPENPMLSRCDVREVHLSTEEERHRPRPCNLFEPRQYDEHDRHELSRDFILAKRAKEEERKLIALQERETHAAEEANSIAREALKKATEANQLSQDLVGEVKKANDTSDKALDIAKLARWAAILSALVALVVGLLARFL